MKKHSSTLADGERLVDVHREGLRDAEARSLGAVGLVFGSVKPFVRLFELCCSLSGENASPETECPVVSCGVMGRPSTTIPSRPDSLVSTAFRSGGSWYSGVGSLLIGVANSVGPAWARSDVLCTLHVLAHRQQ